MCNIVQPDFLGGRLIWSSLWLGFSHTMFSTLLTNNNLPLPLDIPIGSYGICSIAVASYCSGRLKVDPPWAASPALPASMGHIAFPSLGSNTQTSMR